MLLIQNKTLIQNRKYQNNQICIGPYYLFTEIPYLTFSLLIFRNTQTEIIKKRIILFNKVDSFILIDHEKKHFLKI
ncbi:hypothetical protein COJ46_10250 [Bacillus sp. AFS077874]|nr:hypothetical protein CON00_03550 [Bacillus sp. AFS096315]PFM81291.1 hypothetical protein COJ46_10250 [Bacillus sp. AFS077874]